MIHVFDPMAGFFVWCHYPLGVHTPEVCRGFSEAVPGGSSLPEAEVRRRAEGLHRSGGGRFVCHDVLTDGGARWPTLTLDVRRLASCEGHEFGCCDEASVRPGSLTVLLVGDKRYTRSGDEASMAAFLAVVEEFVLAFRPTFGFGCREFNRWCEERGSMPPPETRLWPVTIFDVSAYPRELATRLATLVVERGDEWSLTVCGRSHVVLAHKPLDVAGVDVDPSATEAVLGTGADVLLPNGECGAALGELCHLVEGG